MTEKLNDIQIYEQIQKIMREEEAESKIRIAKQITKLFLVQMKERK